MHRRIRRAVLAAIAAMGCSRNLDLPSANPVALTPSSASVAPRETLALTARGGTGGYRFSFAPEGRLSGADATVDETTGVYRAGSIGPAQDVVRVTDASGRTADARVAVGPPLAATPPVVVTAPGGTTTVVAAGGQPPYVFALVDGQPLSSLTVAPDGLSATHVAGPLGDRIETVEIRDQTWTPADGARPAAASAIHVAAAVKVYANTSGRVAPHEAVDFLAVGGQPPYTYFFANAAAGFDPPSGGTVGATGHYQAGPAGAADGSVFDEVSVRDAFGQEAAPMRITVGAPLSLTLPVARLSPFAAASLVAAGGKPPYRYGFDVRGDRSAGTVDAVTGRYVPGDAQGASDVLAVTDATGVARATLETPAIGFRDLYVGSNPRRALEACLRGERAILSTTQTVASPIQDALVFRWAYAYLTGVTEVLFPRGLEPAVSIGYLAQGEGEPFALELDGDGQDEIVVFRPGAVAVLDPDLTGGLVLDADLAVSALPTTYAVARVPGTTRFLTTASCPGGLVDVDLSRTPVSGCVPGPTPSAGALALGDFDGDGLVDLAQAAYFAAISRNGVGVAFGNGAGFDPFVALPLPAGCGLVGSGAPRWAGGLVAAVDPADGMPRIHVPLLCGSAQAIGRVDARVRTALAWSPSTPVGLGRPSPIHAIAAYRAGPSTPPILAAWDAASSGVEAVSIDPSGSATVFDPLPGPFDEGLGWVSFPDVNGDGVPDLFATGIGDSAFVFLGDGDGGFGRVPRFGGLKYAAAVDLDGDELTDLVAVTSSGSLQVLFGGAHQLARGPVTTTTESAGALAAGDFGLRAGATVVPEAVWQGRTGAFFRARVHADGTVTDERLLTTTPSPGQSALSTVGGLRRAVLRAPHAADAWGSFTVTVNGNPVLYAALLLLDGPQTARQVIRMLPGTGCVFAPVGLGDGAADAPADLAAVCPSGDDLVLHRARFSAGGYGGWSAVRTWAGAAGAAAQVSWAGRDAATGAAYFVGAPAGAPGREVLAITVAAGPTMADPLVAGAATLGTAAEVPLRAAVLADVDGDGTQDLVAYDPGAGLVLLGAGSPDALTFTPATRFVAPAGGTISGAMRLAPGGGRDLLVRLGDYWLVMRNRGAASF